MKFILSILVMSFALSAYAEVNTEVFYKAEAGERAVSVAIDYFDNAITNSATDTDFGLSSGSLRLGAEYGLNEHISLFGSIGGGIASDSDDDNLNGLDPLHLGAKYLNNFGSSSVYTELLTSISLEDNDCDNTGACNRSDGTTLGILSIGYGYELPSSHVGLKADIGLFTTKGKTASGPFEREPGVLVTAFYERMLSKSLLMGLAINYSIGTSDLGANNSIANYGLFAVEGEDNKLIGATLNFKCSASESADLLAKISFDSLLENERVSTYSGKTVSAALGYRYKF